MAKKNAVMVKGALNSLAGELAKIPAEEVQAPLIPVERLVAEGLALEVTTQRVREELLAAGLDPAAIDGLAAQAHATAEAQADLIALRGLKRSEAEVALEESAIDLRSDLIASGRFALRNDRDAQVVLDRIQEGEGLDDLVQDLKELAVFIDRYHAAFARVGGKPEASGPRAQKIAAELGAFLAARRAGDEEESAAKERRDRVATLLAATMAEVRATGTFVFRRDARMLSKFRSAYNLEHRSRRKKTTETAEPTVE